MPNIGAIYAARVAWVDDHTWQPVENPIRLILAELKILLLAICGHNRE